MAKVRAFRKGFYESLHVPGTKTEEFEHPNPKEIANWAEPVGSEIKADAEVPAAVNVPAVGTPGEDEPTTLSELAAKQSASSSLL